MHVHFLDPYRERISPIHRLDARVKLSLSLIYILTVALTPEAAWPAYILLFALILAAELLSALGLKHVMKRAALALPFVLAALPLVFTTPGTEWARWEVGSVVLTVTGPGVARFAGIALKSWLSVQAAILLAASTPFPDLLMAMRALHIPRLLVAMFGLTWRYLFVLVDEALRLIRARAARSGGSRPGGSLAWRAKVAGGMAGNLFLRAFERSDRIYMAMIARGYDGEVRSLPLGELTGKSRLVLTGGAALLVLILLLGFLLRGG
jgi:cobalt/nickel transport system permease protein